VHGFLLERGHHIVPRLRVVGVNNDLEGGYVVGQTGGGGGDGCGAIREDWGGECDGEGESDDGGEGDGSHCCDCRWMFRVWCCWIWFSGEMMVEREDGGGRDCEVNSCRWKMFWWRYGNCGAGKKYGIVGKLLSEFPYEAFRVWVCRKSFFCL